MTNSATNSQIAIRSSVTTRDELSAIELDAVVGGQAAPTNVTGGGNPSIWAKIKSLAFGVDASFF